MRQSIKLYNWSDLHLEKNELNHHDLFNELKLDNKCINVLALTGDISTPLHQSFSKFFTLASQVFDVVLYVAGNHEYHSDQLTYTELKQLIKLKLKSYSNVYFLDDQYVELYDYVFIGTTLWSHIPECHFDYINSKISDYKCITWNQKLISPFEVNQLNRNAVNFINNTLNKFKKPCIILSHHSPVYSSIERNIIVANPKFIGDIGNCAYHNNLDLLLKAPLYMWIFGHTHYRNYFYINDVILWTNQYGYNGEITSKYDPNLHFILE